MNMREFQKKKVIIIIIDHFLDTNYFDRVIYIKELLFFVHKDENDMLATK